MKYALSGGGLRKSINFAAGTEDNQSSERICSGIGERLAPEYAQCERINSVLDGRSLGNIFLSPSNPISIANDTQIRDFQPQLGNISRGRFQVDIDNQ